jgi:hypothetical protein
VKQGAHIPFTDYSRKEASSGVQVEVEVEVKLRPTVSWVLVSDTHMGAVTNFSLSLKFSFRQLRLCYFIAPSLTRGRVCNLLYSCFWAKSEQALLGRSPAELTAIFYCLI